MFNVVNQVGHIIRQKPIYPQDRLVLVEVILIERKSIALIKVTIIKQNPPVLHLEKDLITLERRHLLLHVEQVNLP